MSVELNGFKWTTWDDVRKKERGISQRELEELSGVKQPVIARMENGSTTPNLSTVLKVLAPLGKTLYIGDLKQG